MRFEERGCFDYGVAPMQLGQMRIGKALGHKTPLLLCLSGVYLALEPVLYLRGHPADSATS